MSVTENGGFHPHLGRSVSESSSHAESNEDVLHQREVDGDVESMSPVSSNTRRVSLNFYQDLEDLDEEIPETRFKWTREYVEDFVNVICESDYYRGMLIFSDTPNLKNGYIYVKAVEEANRRVSNHIKKMKNLPKVSQARNKFKKLVSICRLTAKSCMNASQVEDRKREKGFGKWFDKLYPLVKARDSGQMIDHVIKEDSDIIDEKCPLSPETRLRLMQQPGRVRTKRFTWTHEYTNDLVDIICKSDLYKRKLIHTRNLNARNTTVYRRIVAEMVDRARRHLETVDAYPNAKQARTKFKKLVSTVRRIAASGQSMVNIQSYKDKAGFGRWFLQLYPLITSREFGHTLDSTEVSMVSNTSEPPVKRLRTIDMEHLSASGLSVSGLSASGLSASGLTASGLTASGLSASGFSSSGLSAVTSALNTSVNGYSTTSSVLDTSVNGPTQHVPLQHVSPEHIQNRENETEPGNRVISPIRHQEGIVPPTPKAEFSESTQRNNIVQGNRTHGISANNSVIISSRPAQLKSDEHLRNITDQSAGKGSSKRKMSNPTYRRQPAEQAKEGDGEVRDLLRELISCINTVVQNNPIDKLLAHIAEENKRAREHNLRLFQMLCQLITPNVQQRAAMQDGHASSSSQDTMSSLAFEAICQLQYQNMRSDNAHSQSNFTASHSHNQATASSSSFNEGQK